MFHKIFAYVLLLFIALTSFPLLLWSQSDIRNEEYNFRWLDPDKKIYVIQNRKYEKQGRFELSGGGGLNLSGAYINGFDFYSRAVFYASETIGVTFLGVFQTSSENRNLEELKKVSTAIPNIRYMKSMFAGYITFVPFYGKFNLFNRIFYVDWHWEVGVGSVSSEYDLNSDSEGDPNLGISKHTALTWGTGMKFFISRNFAARLDMQALYYNAPAIEGNELSTTETKSEYNYLLMLGFGFHF